MMLQKIVIGLMGGVLVVGGAYAYKERLELGIIEQKKMAIMQAHNSFFPKEWHYNDPLAAYERDALTNILSYYRRDERQAKIFFLNDPFHVAYLSEMTGADYATFVPIDQEWSKDVMFLYRNGVPVLSGFKHVEMLGGGNYLRTDTMIYAIEDVGLTALSGVDRASFSLLPAEYHTVVPFAKDAKRVYRGSKIISGLDAKTVKVLSSHYVQDKKQIIYIDDDYLHVLKKVDRKTFELVNGNGYDAKDRYGYFYQGQRVQILEL